MRAKKGVLIIADAVLTGPIQGLLEEYGYAVSCCFTGSDAIELAKKQKFDVILTDYQMPGMRGDVVCRLLRHHHPEVFIIGISSERHGRAFLRAGADTFIQKDQLVQNLTLLIQSRTAL
jgi:CheY-like chemotaxis protein